MEPCGMSYTAVAANQGWDPRVTRVDCGTSVSAHLVQTQRYLIVVDTLVHPAAGEELLAIARSLLDDRQLLVVTTHADWDHYFGNQVFPCPILGLRSCVERVAVDGPVELARKVAEDAALYGGVRLTPPTLAFEGELDIDGGDLHLQLIPTPGHRLDHIAVWIPELALLLPGDAIEAPIPITDDDPIQLRALRRTLEAMVALQPAWVLANHAVPSAGTDLVRENLRYLQELHTAARRVRAGEAASMEEAFPYRWPEAAEFYRVEHARACRSALETLPV